LRPHKQIGRLDSSFKRKAPEGAFPNHH
jgi:hypothetical protein